MIIKKEKGFVLLTILIFIIILTSLVISSLQISITESKINSFFINKRLAVASAKKSIKQKEKDLENGIISSGVKLLSSEDRSCGINFYQITSTNTVLNSTVTLQTTFAKIGNIAKCDKPLQVRYGRQSFRWIMSY